MEVLPVDVLPEEWEVKEEPAEEAEEEESEEAGEARPESATAAWPSARVG